MTGPKDVAESTVTAGIVQDDKSKDKGEEEASSNQDSKRWNRAQRRRERSVKVSNPGNIPADEHIIVRWRHRDPLAERRRCIIRTKTFVL
jgi:hypothetical protein